MRIKYRALSFFAIPAIVLLCSSFVCSSLVFAQAKENAVLVPPILVPYEVVDVIQSKSIPKSLTGKPGNPVKGEALMINRKKGNCLACHRLSAFDEKAKTKPNLYGDGGEIGPTLDGVAKRYSEGQFRLLLVDAKKIFADTMMPSFYKIKGFHRIGTKFDQKPILQAHEVEDIVSFLLTVK